MFLFCIVLYMGLKDAYIFFYIYLTAIVTLFSKTHQCIIGLLEKQEKGFSSLLLIIVSLLV